MPGISTRLPVAASSVPSGSWSEPVCPGEHPLVGERVALFDVADIAMGDIRECGQLPGETVLDCASALEGAVGHQLHGVLGVQIHHAVEITCVVQLDVSLQEASVTIHCPSPLLLPSDDGQAL
jgi:hypothetical protein